MPPCICSFQPAEQHQVIVTVSCCGRLSSIIVFSCCVTAAACIPQCPSPAVCGAACASQAVVSLLCYCGCQARLARLVNTRTSVFTGCCVAALSWAVEPYSIARLPGSSIGCCVICQAVCFSLCCCGCARQKSLRSPALPSRCIIPASPGRCGAIPVVALCQLRSFHRPSRPGSVVLPGWLRLFAALLRRKAYRLVVPSSCVCHTLRLARNRRCHYRRFIIVGVVAAVVGRPVVLIPGSVHSR
jgi:hypothetical protein